MARSLPAERMQITLATVFDDTGFYYREAKLAQTPEIYHPRSGGSAQTWSALRGLHVTEGPACTGGAGGED